MLVNPFLTYMLTFGGALAIYQLGWSSIYPQMTWDMLAFFLFSFMLAGTFAAAVQPAVAAIRKHQPGLLPGWTIAAPLVCFAADFIHTGGIPLLDLLLGRYVYMSFSGVPSLHVFTVTFGSAFSTIRFADFLYEKHRLLRIRYLAEACIPVVYLLLIVYRGPAMIVLTTWAFVFIIRSGLTLKRGLIIACVGSVLLLAAGKLGEARSGTLIDLGRPTQEFQESRIPNSAFWVYLYATGPIANFQYAVSNVDPQYNLWKMPEFIIGEMLPDAISHRLLAMIDVPIVRDVPEFSPHFNVSSLFGRSWIFFGWIGVLTMLTYFVAAVFVYVCLLRASALAVPSLALLNTFVVYCVFDNMIAITAISLQLFWPLLLGVLLMRQTARRAAIYLC